MRFDVALVALSARALARSARRAGLTALAVDLFADADTRAHAHAIRTRSARRTLAFDRCALLETLAANAPEGTPVVFGAGFEHAPRLMAEIGRRWPIRGASPETVARLKDPKALAGLLARLGVAHPEIGTDAALIPPLGQERADGRSPAGWGAPQDDQRPASKTLPDPTLGAGPPSPLPRGGISGAWLSKRIGASGGAHIRIDAREGSRRYLQQRVEGRSLSALFLADGRSARVIGFSEQWTDPTARAPYRYGGAVGPIAPPAPLAAEIAAALDGVVAETALVGLASADLILSSDIEDRDFWLLEINPRPGATLDVFDRAPSPSLLGLHLAACDGRLPAALPPLGRSRAAATVYAPRAVTPATLPRPVWTADWPSCDETVPAGAPVCTIVADGASPSAARALLAQRRAALLASLRAVPAPTNPMVSA